MIVQENILEKRNRLNRIDIGSDRGGLREHPDHVGIETFDDVAGQIAWSHHWIDADKWIHPKQYTP